VNVEFNQNEPLTATNEVFGSKHLSKLSSLLTATPAEKAKLRTEELGPCTVLEMHEDWTLAAACVLSLRQVDAYVERSSWQKSHQRWWAIGAWPVLVPNQPMSLQRGSSPTW